MNKPHKHAELIKAWADGAQIQVSSFDCLGKGHNWVNENNPSWREDLEYRIKPREFEEGAWYPTLSNGNKGVHQYVAGMFCTHENYPEFPGHNFDWIGDKLEIEWPES